MRRGHAGYNAMDKQILVPLDGSPLAEGVLPYAAEFACEIGAGLILFQVAQPPVVIEAVIGTVPVATDNWKNWDVTFAEARHYLRGVQARLEAEGLRVRVEVRENEPARAIVAYSERPEVVMIGMATHGRSGLSRLVFGSVAERVLHEVRKPVLLVRPDGGVGSRMEGQAKPRRPLRKVLVPLDGTRFAERALEDAEALAVVTGATIALVCATHGSGDVAVLYLAGAAQALEDKGFTVETYVTQGSAASTILQVVESARADVIVMATHGRVALQRLWLGSVALKVLQASRVPVLLVRARVSDSQFEEEQGALADEIFSK